MINIENQIKNKKTHQNMINFFNYCTKTKFKQYNFCTKMRFKHPLLLTPYRRYNFLFYFETLSFFN